MGEKFKTIKQCRGEWFSSLTSQSSMQLIETTRPHAEILKVEKKNKIKTFCWYLLN